MKNFGNWILRNLSNIFGVIGIGLTLYFGVFYIPSWLRESQNERLKNAQQSVEQSIKELIYSDSTCSLLEIQVLLEAKEIELNSEYPLSIDQILVCVQESFMQDKFLPLEKRKSLINEIQVIKEQIKPDTLAAIKKESELTRFSFISILSVVSSIIGVIVGIISFYVKFRIEKEKQEEIDNQISQSETIDLNKEYAYEFERGIYSIIRNFPGVEDISDFDFPARGFDIEFKYNAKKYFVEIKCYTRSKVGLGSLQKFVTHMKGREGEAWFIYNTDLTDMVKRKVEELKRISVGRSINLIKVNSVQEFGNRIKELLPTK